MATTLGQFRSGLRTVLADPAQWRDSLLLQWTQEALEDFSQALPFRDVAAIAADAGVRQYLLNDLTQERLQDILAVEFPAGLSPRRFLVRREERHPAFLGGPYYDLNKQNWTISSEHCELFFLVLGEEPLPGETIWFEYTRSYTPPAADDDLIPIPDGRLGVLRLYVFWKAAQTLELDESISLQRKTDMLQALGGSAARAAVAYRQRLGELVEGVPGSLTAQWVMDGKDRVY